MMDSKIIPLVIISLIFITSITEAQIVYTDIPDTSINYPSIDYLGDSTNYYDLDINNDSVVDFRFELHRWQTSETPSSQPINHVSQLKAIGENGVLNADDSSPPICTKAFVEKSTIDTSGSWNFSNGIGTIYVAVIGMTINCNVPFNDNYYGIRLNINGAIHFGWLHLNANSSGEIVLKGYAYNTKPNESIMAGSTTANTVNNNVSAKQAKAYPNPFSNNLNIELTNVATPAQLKIRNVMGKVVREFLVGTPLHGVNLSDISNGIYFLTIENNGEVLVMQKIIKK